ncbi:MAG: Glu/Leu/Phe/Val dehydrogenase dimerization domain-containing protein [Thermodesulfobacteriota bacterium]
METLLRKWDGESTIIRFDRPTHAMIIIAIHSTRLGPATGGTRMKPYPDLRAALSDALKLAASMTYKFAVANFPRGGGKAVIAPSPEFDQRARPDLLRRYGTLIHGLGGLFQTGVDVGTSPSDMDVIAETGAPYVACRTPEKGGAGGSGQATALGVFSGMQAVCEYLFGDESPAGKRVLVQGAGSVGQPLIGLLREAGAEVLFSDVDQDTIRHFRDELGLAFVPPEAIYETPCDIFAPCALGGIINHRTIPRLQCLAVAGAANNQLAEPDDADRLRERNILYAPDYVINFGGAIAITGIEDMGWSRVEAEEKVKSVRETLRRIFEVAVAEGLTTDATARRMAESRLSGAQFERTAEKVMTD